jgi:hypothetical protein
MYWFKSLFWRVHSDVVLRFETLNMTLCFILKGYMGTVPDWKCQPLGSTYTETPKSSYSSASSYVTLSQIFLTSKFSYLLFFQLSTHKTKAETAYRSETTNSKPPEPICTIDDESKIGSSSHIIFMTLFFSAK